MEQTKHNAKGVLRMCHSEGLIVCRWATEKKKKGKKKTQVPGASLTNPGTIAACITAQSLGNNSSFMPQRLFL